MIPERLRQIEELYHLARERKPGERAAFLIQACTQDEDLRREVESLLASDPSSAALLEARPQVGSTEKAGLRWRSRRLGKLLGFGREMQVVRGSTFSISARVASARRARNQSPIAGSSALQRRAPAGSGPAPI
jgi:hypothetical protein